MSTRRWSIALVVAALLARSDAAHAQCAADASSCVSCHEVRGLHPVLDDGSPWHRDHAFGDLCATCHGGDPAATTEDAAHLGRRAPLADPAAACAGCHPDDRDARAAAYRAVMPATPPPPPPPPPRTRSSAGVANLALAAASVVLAVLIALRLTRPRRSLVGWLRAKTWSPYVAGAGLGLIVAISEAMLGRPISASGAFDKLAAYPGRAIFPDAPYYAHVMTPGITWPVWLMIGVLAGSFASSLASREARLRWLPDLQWTSRFGRSRVRRLAIAFVGAALVQIGAGIAGGCTSGLAISGGAVLAPAAFLFMAGMFAGGIPTAWLWYRRGGSR